MSDLSTKPTRGGPSAVEAKLLATLLHLQHRARAATELSELDFILVNESFNLFPYRQAALWLKDGGIKALSGMAIPEGNAPYVHWLNSLIRQLPPEGMTTAQVLKPDSMSEAVRAQWGEWLPAEVLLIPIPALRQFRGGFLVLARDISWQPAEISLLSQWGQAWSHARALVELRGGLKSLVTILQSRAADEAYPSSGGGKAGLQQRLRSPRIWVLLLLITLMFVPVRLTVLAPAELVPRNPDIIRAPLDGVVEQILVQPNEWVAQGTPLLVFERSAISNRLLVAQGVLNTLRAEYRQRAQQALSDSAGAVELAMLEGQMREKELEIDYLSNLLSRGEVLSPQAGVVLLDDPLQWVGRPVVTGQRILVVADEQAVQLEAWLAPGDAISLEPGARVRLFLNADPLNPVEAELEYVAFQAQERPDGQYAYRVQARLLDETAAAVRVGLKGTAKLEGERVTLAYWMLRRPLASLRGWLGL
ncbi:HlyD family efflux transporter periplasmic adaptor subunit [Nitrincola sp. MINF-07-Sa-05]|uniref:HlyD family efflux transporter periplasmic adaptor subunit n=1 Tax=Nitrincola salilacus TaxID=3400273 RepID=UPI00391845D6